MLKALLAIAITAIAGVGTPTGFSSTSGIISGVIMSDQWGNPWVEVGTVSGQGAKTLVSVFDCAGNQHVIGEVPDKSLGSMDNFSGFKPYLNATLMDLQAVSDQREFTRECIEASNAGHACGPNPRRRDCRPVLVPVENPSIMLRSDAWDQWQAMHKKHTP